MYWNDLLHVLLVAFWATGIVLCRGVALSVFTAYKTYKPLDLATPL